MEQKRREHLDQIPEADWEKTPASVKQLVEAMQQRLEKMASQLAEVLAVQEQQVEKRLSDLKKFIITTVTRPTRIRQKTA